MSLLFARANSETVKTTNASLFSARTAFSVSYWVKHTALNNYQVVIDESAGAGELALSIFYTSTGVFYSIIWDNSDNPYYLITNGTTVDSTGTWYHVVVTWDTTQENMYYYRNGTRITDLATDNTLAAALKTETSTTYLGSRSNGNYFADASMEHVGIWDHALSAEQISTMYKMRLRPNHPLFMEGLLSYWPLDRPKTGNATVGDIGLRDTCVTQTGGALVNPGSPPHADWTADTPGLNMHTGIPIRPADYGIETIRRRRETA